MGRGKLVPSNNGFLAPNSFEASPLDLFSRFCLDLVSIAVDTRNPKP